MGQRVTKVRLKTNNNFGESVPIGVDSVNVMMSDGSGGLDDALTTIRNSITPHRTLTWTVYNSLPQQQKSNGTIYYVY